MSRFTNLIEYSPVTIANTLELVPSIGRNYLTRVADGLSVRRLAKKNRTASKYSRRFGLIASVLLAAIALTITVAWDANPAAADSITCGINEITFTTKGLIEVPVISNDGKRIAFMSDGNFTGGNADGNREIFFYDTTTNSFTQVTNTTNPNRFQQRRSRNQW